MNNIGIVSGYFNPLHAGHLDYINNAKKDCDFLVVIVNNDYQVRLKKSKQFMDENHRLKIIENLKSVDFAIIAKDMDGTVRRTLKEIKLLFPEAYNIFTFYNSGDRNPDNLNFQEDNFCKSIGINTKFLDFPKIFSSSDLK